MTTDRASARRRTALWLLAPVAVGVFGISTDWAVRNNPLDDKEPGTSSAVTETSATQTQRQGHGLEQRLAAATERYAATREALLGLEQSLRRGAAEIATLRGERSAAPSSGAVPAHVPAPVAAPPAPPPVAPPPAAPPAPPPVDTSTGAS
jgi:hypothetical protein